LHFLFSLNIEHHLVLFPFELFSFIFLLHFLFSSLSSSLYCSLFPDGGVLSYQDIVLYFILSHM
jgi:hypothetical protein